MGFLDNLERGLEKVVTGFFRGASTAAIKPVELTTALRNEMDRGIMPISEDRSLAPNDFTVTLSEKDFETAKNWGPTVVNELARVTAEHASAQGYSVHGDVMIHFKADPDFRTGNMEIDSAIKESKPAAAQPKPRQAAPARPSTPASDYAAPKTTAQPRPVQSPAPQPAPAPMKKQPVLEVSGQRFALNHHSIILGRSASTDIPVDDSGVSRQHVRVESRGSSYFAVDMGSTNGTYVDGKKIAGESPLFDGSIIIIGQTKIVFRLINPSNGGRA